MTFARIKFVLLPLLLLMLLGAAAAEKVQLFDWKSVNVQGMGYVTGLVIRPNAPYDVYIRTDVGGVYRFDRATDRWIPLMDALDTPSSVGTESIAIDPSTPARVYAVADRPRSVQDGKITFAGEVWVSEDRGATWRGTGLVNQGIYQGNNDDYRVETGERLAVDPANPNIIYLSTRRNGLWKGLRSADGSYQWSQVHGGLPAWAHDPAGYSFVTFGPGREGSPAVIYTGVHSSGVWRSMDGGVTWANIGGASNPGRAAVASDGTLYVSFSGEGPGGVRRFANDVWTEITPGAKDRRYIGITVDPTNPRVVMVGSDGDVWRSTDAGASWSAQSMLMQRVDPHKPGSNPSAPPYYISSSGASGGVAALVIDPGNPKQVWWTNGWGAARTDDVTAAQPYWAWHMNNLEELCSVMVRVPPKPKAEGGADMVSAVMDMVGFRHADRDQVPESKINPVGVPVNPSPSEWWERKDYGATLPVPWPHISMGSGLDYSYHAPDHLAIVGHIPWQAWPVYGASDDNGRTWKAFPSMPTEKLWSGDQLREAFPIAGQIALSSTNPLNMTWAPTFGTFDGMHGSAELAPWPHYTLDGGKTWQLCKLANATAPAAPANSHDNKLLHADALPKSIPNSISPYVSTNILSADRNDPEGKRFYYFDGESFYYSEDGGATWTRSAATGFPAKRARINLVSNPARMGDIWMAFSRGADQVEGYKLLHSTDGGRTFAPIASLDFADKVTFGAGPRPDAPFIYIVGRPTGDAPFAMYKSEDGGASWIRISDPTTNRMTLVAHMEGDMRTPNLLYLALDGRGLMYGEFGKH